jgi:DNA-binding transcriptional ArsR family regulator
MNYKNTKNLQPSGGVINKNEQGHEQLAQRREQSKQGFKQPAQGSIEEDVGVLFKILGDRTRLELLFALEKQSMCVNDLVEKLGYSQSLVSHQLKILRDSNIVSTIRSGNKVIYTLADDHVFMLLDIARDHAQERREK